MAKAGLTGRTPGFLLGAALWIGILVVSSPVAADDVRILSLTTNDLVFDPLRARIYASVPSTAAAFGNSIAVVEPVSGVIERVIPAGSEPGKLAISDDAQFLYVALDGTATVRRIDLTLLTPDLEFALGGDPGRPARGPWFVDDMAVLPGTPRSLAVALRFRDQLSPRHAGVAVYDDGVRRPTVTTGLVGSNVIEFSGNATRLYGLNTETSEAGLRRMLVSPFGVTIQDVVPNPFGTGGVTDIEFDAGRLYANTGQVIDPETRILVGTYGSVFPPSLVRPDSTVGRTYFLSGATILGFAQTTFRPVGSIFIQGLSGTASSLIGWGPDRLAFRTSAGQVFLVTATFLTPVTGPGPIVLAPPVNPPQALIARFFQNVLAREPEPAGLAAWAGFLGAHCNARGLDALSRGFFDAEEFRFSRPLSLPGLVGVLYRTFLGRNPEPAGVAQWSRVFREIRLGVATSGFIGSAEFRALLPDRTDRAAVAQVVARLYAEILGRGADPIGLAAWVDFVTATGDVEAAARGFLASPEFEGRPLTAREHVAIFYRAFLGRDPSPADLDAWEEVFRAALLAVVARGFAPAPEFQAQLVPMCR